MAGGTVIAAAAICLVLVLAIAAEPTTEDARIIACDGYKQQAADGESFRKYLKGLGPATRRSCDKTTTECTFERRVYCIPKDPRSRYHDEEVVATCNKEGGSNLLYGDTPLTNEDQPGNEEFNIHVRSIGATSSVSVEMMVVFTSDPKTFAAYLAINNYNDFVALTDFAQVLNVDSRKMLEPGKTEEVFKYFSELKVPAYDTCAEVYMRFFIATGFPDEALTQVYSIGPLNTFTVITKASVEASSCIHPEAVMVLTDSRPIRTNIEVEPVTDASDVEKEGYKMNVDDVMPKLKQILAKGFNAKMKGKFTVEIYNKDTLVASADAVGTLNVVERLVPLVSDTPGEGIFTTSQVRLVTYRSCFTDTNAMLDIFLYYGKRKAHVRVDVAFGSIGRVTTTYWTDILNIGHNCAIVHMCKPNSDGKTTSATVQVCSSGIRDCAFGQINIKKVDGQRSDHGESKNHRRKARASNDEECDFSRETDLTDCITALKEMLGDSCLNPQNMSKLPAICNKICRSQLELLRPKGWDETAAQWLRRQREEEKAAVCLTTLLNTVTLGKAFPAAERMHSRKRAEGCHAWKQWEGEKKKNRNMPKTLQHRPSFCSGRTHKDELVIKYMCARGMMGPDKGYDVNQNGQWALDGAGNRFDMMAGDFGDRGRVMGMGDGADNRGDGGEGGAGAGASGERGPGGESGGAAGGAGGGAGGPGGESGGAGGGPAGGTAGGAGRAGVPGGVGTRVGGGGAAAAGGGGTSGGGRFGTGVGGGGAAAAGGGRTSGAGGAGAGAGGVHGRGGDYGDDIGRDRGMPQSQGYPTDQGGPFIYFSGDSDNNVVKINIVDLGGDRIISETVLQFNCENCKE